PWGFESPLSHQYFLAVRARLPRAVRLFQRLSYQPPRHERQNSEARRLIARLEPTWEKESFSLQVFQVTAQYHVVPTLNAVLWQFALELFLVEFVNLRG